MKDAITWRELFNPNYIATRLCPQMLSKEGYFSNKVVRLRGGGKFKQSNSHPMTVIYDRGFVKKAIFNRVIKQLQPIGLEELQQIVREAYEENI